ncbi:MAG: amino acid permease [Bacteroidetes bacterium]|nr:amino acid permease [Bacteroidota bacterium]
MRLSDLFRKKTIDRILSDASEHLGEKTRLKQSLNVWDLTALGIAAIIGAGIFSTIGTAAASGGPAVSLLFVFTAIACGFSAMCYAQFASRIPISGSAYTYAYASFGELIAWIIGWDLIMEYAVGNIAVAISWSDYFTGFLGGIGLPFPDWLGIDYLSAARGYHSALHEMAHGVSLTGLSSALQKAYSAWMNAPHIGDLHFIANIPAFAITVFITALVYIGIYETKMASNTMVILKIAILLVVIGVGSFYVNSRNWSPFAPNGVGGVLKGVAGVFFAYIGFDAISTTAEECKNPKRDLPRSMIYALAITTVLYILISLVLTGMVHYTELGVGDPLAVAFDKLHLTRLSGIISISAIIAMASVLLVFQVGQPRIWMSMSRDGLLPKIFSKLHPKYKTPGFSTILTGVIVSIPSLFLNLTEVTDLTSIGTLFAFVLVSGGVLMLDKQTRSPEHSGKDKGFRVKYINSRYFLPLIWVGVFVLLYFWNPPELNEFTRFFGKGVGNSNPPVNLGQLVAHQFPMLLFGIAAIIMTTAAVKNKLSLIPVLGLLTNFYLMAQLGITNWMRFIIWLVVGFVIYFSFGRKHSKLIDHNKQ